MINPLTDQERNAYRARLAAIEIRVSENFQEATARALLLLGELLVRLGSRNAPAEPGFTVTKDLDTSAFGDPLPATAHDTARFGDPEPAPAGPQAVPGAKER